MTLKSIYLVESNGLYSKLNEVFELGRRFIQPQYKDATLEHSVSIAASPHISAAGAISPITAGYSVKYQISGTEYTGTVASIAGNDITLTAAPTVFGTNKALRYSSANPVSYTTLATELTNAAAAGKTNFSIVVDTSTSLVSATNLRLNGNYLKAFLAGIYYALDAEGIFNTYEVSLSLDTPSNIVTNIKFTFVLGV